MGVAYPDKLLGIRNFSQIGLHQSGHLKNFLLNWSNWAAPISWECKAFKKLFAERVIATTNLLIFPMIYVFLKWVKIPKVNW
jgi:hypothetical protein